MLLSVATSFMFTELKKNVENGLPANMKSLWDICEIRGMILLSLFLQIVLVVLGNRLRSKGSAKSFIVWLTYLSADWVATTSLGFLMRSDKKRFTELAAFWAPFLLLHLGGPDSITAYSLEDNELWLRHLLGFCFQVTVVIYVFCKFQGTVITYLAIPIFIAAIIKYGERIWSLRSASGYKLKQSLFSSNTLRKLNILSRENTSRNLVDDVKKICHKPEAAYIHIAYTLILLYKPLFLDLNLRFNNKFVKNGGFSGICSSTSKLIDTELGGFSKIYSSTSKLIDTELGFLYDEIYTKRPLLNTSIGVTLRGISFLCSCFALIAFSFIVGLDDAARKQLPDIVISSLLLLGAVVLEIFSIHAHCLSDWSLLWATTCKNNLLSTLICKANAIKLRSNNDGDTMLIPQYNLIDSCLKFWPLPDMDNENFLKKYFCTTWEKIELEKNIHVHLEKRYEIISHSLNIDEPLKKEDYNFGSILNILERRLRRDQREEEDDNDEGIKVLMKLEGFVENLIIWHLATDICYHVDAEKVHEECVSEYKASKLLSDYMLYILVSQSSMFANKGSHELILQETCNQLLVSLSEKARGERLNSGKAGRLAYQASNSYIFVNSKFHLAKMIAKWLQERRGGIKERWELMREVWVDILADVAMNCSGKEHLKCIGRGGDLLTHVFLLIAHYGFSPKIDLIPFRLYHYRDETRWRPMSFYEWALQFQICRWTE